MKSFSRRGVGIIQILVASLCFGSYGVRSKFMGDSFEPFFQGRTRGLIIVLMLLPFVWKELKTKRIQKKDIKWMLIFFIFTALTQAPLYYAFNHMDVGLASLIFFVIMLLMMNIFGFVFLGEKWTIQKALGIMLGCIGLYLIFDISLVAFTMFALLMAVVGGIASGGELASSKKLTGDYTPLYISFLSWFIILITNLPLSLGLGESWLSLDMSEAWGYQIIYSLVSLLGFWLAMSGFQKVESSLGSIVGLTEVVFSVMFGILVFGETLSGYVLVGMCCILGASVLQSTRILRKKSLV